MVPPLGGNTETTIKQQEEAPNNPSISLANVILSPIGKEVVTLNVEMARTPEERSQGLQGRERWLERVFEVLPGATSWTLLIGLATLAWWKPVLAATLVIAFYLYWLLKLFYLTFFLVLAYLRLSIERDTDWTKRIKALDSGEAAPSAAQSGASSTGLARQLSHWLHERELDTTRRSAAAPPPVHEIYHLVIIPIASETREILEPGLESLSRQTFPPRSLLVVLAVEARAPEEVHAGARDLQRRYQARFLDCLVTQHPDGLPGEARVKGANATYAAKVAAGYLTGKGISFERVIVSCFDADTVVSPQYMACLTYHFMLCPERTQASFQPIPVFHNNIWEATGFARVLDIGSSFFQLVEATDPGHLVTFSSHSMSFQALVDVGYWPVDIISDDSAIYWKALLHFEGRYRVVPLYITLSMDMVHADTWWKTAVNVYKQKRRWAWGVENFPLVVRGFLHTPKMSGLEKLRRAFRLLEGHVEWATCGFMLTVIGWLPALFAGREFSSSVMYYSAPRITSMIFRLASLALVTTIVLSLLFLPKTAVKYPLLRRVGHALEWLLIPVIATLFSALPALDAQTRLMFGQYMEFWVTEKQRG